MPKPSKTIKPSTKLSTIYNAANSEEEFFNLLRKALIADKKELRIPELGIALSFKGMPLTPGMGWNKQPVLRIKGGTWKVRIPRHQRGDLLVARGPAILRLREIVSSQSTPDLQAAFAILMREIEESSLPTECLKVENGELILDFLETKLKK